MANSYDALTKALNDEIQQQSRTVLGSIVNASQLLPYNQDGVGDFPYWVTTGPQGALSNLTYGWIDQIVGFDETLGALTSNGQDLVAQLSTTLYPSLSYALSAADQKQLQDTASKTTLEGNALVTAYTQNVAAIPAGTVNNLDYVIGQILSWGSETQPVSLPNLQASYDMTGLLPRMPASGSAVLPVLSSWLDAASATLPLQNAVSFANKFVSYLKSAVSTPNAATSSATLDPNSPTAQPVNKPRWDINIAPNAIQNGLQNEGKAVKLTVSASSFSGQQTQLSVNGKAAGSFGLSWLTFGVGGGASYNVSSGNTSAASATVEVSYPGVTAVPVRPMEAQLNSGWLAQNALTEAAKNGSTLPPARSGYVFSKPIPSSMRLQRNGTFGSLNTIVISNQPTIKITYTSGDSKTYKSVFEQNSSWSVSFMGLFDIASGSQSYYKAKVDDSSSGSGFTITIAPDGTQFTVPDAQKRAKVLAAAVSWPCDVNG